MEGMGQSQYAARPGIELFVNLPVLQTGRPTLRTRSVPAPETPAGPTDAQHGFESTRFHVAHFGLNAPGVALEGGLGAREGECISVCVCTCLTKSPGHDEPWETHTPPTRAEGAPGRGSVFWFAERTTKRLAF